METVDRRHDGAKRPIISFGDAVEAYHDLEPWNAATRGSILEMLGLGIEPSNTAPVNIGASKPSSTRRAATAQDERPAPRVPHRPPDSSAPRQPDALSSSVVSSRVTRVSTGDAPMQPPAWLDERPALGPHSGMEAAREVSPLFGRVQRRSILSAATATIVEEGDVDMEAVVAMLASGRPLRALPQKSSLTTRRGAQVLLDRGLGMAPFRQDQLQLRDALDDILGDEHFDVHGFIGCPSRGLMAAPMRTVRAIRSENGDWRPPPANTPIVVLTDLGIGGPIIDEERATAAEWVSFADRVRGLGLSLVGLIPYEASRWPPRIARAMPLLHWSERTTVGAVRNAMRDARKRHK